MKKFIFEDACTGETIEFSEEDLKEQAKKTEEYLKEINDRLKNGESVSSIFDELMGHPMTFENIGWGADDKAISMSLENDQQD